MKKIFFSILLSCVFVSYCQAQTWDIKVDFPSDPNGFNNPYNGWTTGVKVVKSELLTPGEYDYDAIEQGFFEGDTSKLIYKLGLAQLSDPNLFENDPNLFTNGESNLYALINRDDAGTGGAAALAKFGANGCVALKSFIGNLDPELAKERYDSYLRWTAPAAGRYYIQLGMMYNGYVVKTTISVNGKPVPGLEDVLSTTGANTKKINWFHPSYALNAGDVIEMSFQAAGESAGWKYTRVFGIISTAPEYIVQDSFEDPALPGWTPYYGGGVLTNLVARTSSNSVEFPWGSGSDYRRITLTPFVASDARNIDLKVRFYEMPAVADTCIMGTTEINSVGAVIRVTDSAGTYNQMFVQAANNYAVTYWTKSSVTAQFLPKPFGSGSVKPEPGWNEYRITVNDQGHVMMYINDIPASYDTTMLGIKEIAIGQWKGKVAEGAEKRTIFDDLEITYLAEDQFENFPADPNIPNLHHAVYPKGDLDRNYKVDLKDVSVVAQNWLVESGTTYPASISGGYFFPMEYGNFLTTISGAEIGGGFGRNGGAMIVRDVSRSGNESLSIPKGRYGRLWRQFYGTSNNNCTATVWLYYPSDTYVGPLEVNLLDASYNQNTVLRVYAGYEYDPMHPGLDTNAVKTTQGIDSWTTHEPNLIQLDEWNKVQFVQTPENGTNVYINDIFIRNFTPMQFEGAAVMSVGKDWYFSTTMPIKGQVFFDDMSVFDNATEDGDADAVYMAEDLNLSGIVDTEDIAALAETWLQEASISDFVW